jgi:hypothetical protein
LILFCSASFFKKKKPRAADKPKKALGYQSPAKLSSNASFIHATIKGSIPPIQPAARLCGNVAALFLDFAGNNSARMAA